VIRHWPGADTIYDQRWIRRTPAELAASVTALDSDQAWRAAGEDAHAQSLAFELGAVCRSWHQLILGKPLERSAAR
jgi:hypothetical protein